MPKCAKCQTPYEESQKFCMKCGTQLAPPEEKPSFCPQCGVQMSDQVFCHECGASLEEGTSGVQTQLPQTPSHTAPALGKPASPSPGKGMSIQKLALVGAGLGVAIVVLALIIAGISNRGTTSAPMAEKTSPPVASSASPKEPEVLGPPFFSKPTQVAAITAKPTVSISGDGAAPKSEPGLSVAEEIEEVLFTMKTAQENKDILQLMKCFSPSFPDLDGKRQTYLKNWGTHDYFNLVFTIDEIRQTGADSQQVRVTWDYKTRNLKTGKEEATDLNLKFSFANEGGQWRITSMEKDESS